MQSLLNGLAHFYALLAIIPFVSFALFGLIFYFVYHSRTRAVTIAMDITTVLLIGSVSVMYDYIFQPKINGFWWVVLFFLISAGLIGNMQTRKRGSIDFQRMLKVLFRFGFLVLSMFYVLFLVIGIGKSIFIL